MSPVVYSLEENNGDIEDYTGLIIYHEQGKKKIVSIWESITEYGYDVI